MTPEERAGILVTARLLRASAIVAWLAVGLTVVAAAALVHSSAVVTPLVAMFLGIGAIYYGVRMSFDAALLEDIASERLTTAQLDVALGSLRKGTSDRSWSDRCRGARRLAIFCAAATVAEAVVMVFIRW